MCVAIVQPIGKRVSDDILAACFKSNNNGAGMAFVRKGKIVIDKGYMMLDGFLKGYDRHWRENPDTPFLLHCRIATKGKVCPDNTHPFKIRGGAMIHNGTLWHSGHIYDELSDTREFAETLHNELSKQKVTENRDEIEKAVGYNRLAFLFEDKSYVIINEGGPGKSGPGMWLDGVWYSNDFWKRMG